MNAVFIEKTLFPLIRAGLGIGPAVETDGIDCELLLKIGKRQSVLPLIREGLRISGARDDCFKLIDGACSDDILRFVFRDAALDSIAACFEKNGIPFILLKGAVLRDLYPEKWMRTSCDIDVLVKKEDLDRAVAALEAETEFRFRRRMYHDVSMIMPHVHLELHFSITEHTDNIDRLLSRVWDYASPAGGQRYVLSPEFQIFHVAAHMSYHFIRGGLGVRHYIDLWLLRHRTEYDESAVREMCESCGILKFYEECGNLSEVWLSGAAHTPVTAALEKHSLGGGVFGNKKNAALHRQRKQRGAKYYFGRLFISRTDLQELYPKLEKYPALLPYYQAKRWFLAAAHKRKTVKGELDILKNTTEKEIESFDELMKSVGL